MNEDNLMSAKLLIDNFVRVKRHTIFDFYIELESELRSRDFEILQKPDEDEISNHVGDRPIKRKVDLVFIIRKENIPVWIEADFDDWLCWGVCNGKDEEIKVSKEVSSKINSFVSKNSEFIQEDIWLCWKYLGENDEERIYFPNFSGEGTFRLISPQYRKSMIQRLVNEIEEFIDEVLKY